MKCIPVITASLLLGFASTTSNAQSTEQVLGAVAGGALGNTIGDGDGRKAATILGAIIGYRNGDRILNGQSDGVYYSSHRNSYVDYNGLTRNQYRIHNYCKSQVPPKYQNNPGAFRSWVAGCVARVEQMQEEIEAQAYQDALNGDGK